MKKTARLEIVMEPDLKTELERVAEQEYMSIGAFIRKACRKALKERQDAEAP